jgi:hypothetical protein
MDTLIFTCPECGKNELGSVEQVFLTYPITRIPEDGDLDYDYDNPEAGDGDVLCYQCLNCGYELQDEAGNTITDCLKVPDWIQKHGSGKSN